MSSFCEKKVNCPNCQNEISFVKWDSVNVTLDPHFKTRILNSEFFDITCSNCQSVIKIYYELLYHDMDNKFFIYFIPFKNKENLDSIKNLIPDYLEDDLDGSLKNYIKRIAVSEKDFIEKIMIFENRLDDRIIELLKLYASECFMKESNIKYSSDDVFIKIKKDNVNLFAQVDETKYIAMDCGMQVYEDILPRVLFSFGGLSSNEFLLIDSKWALAVSD